MPITPFLHNQAFDPDAIEEMSSAFVKACANLGLANKPDQMTELVARHIIEAAQRGIRTETGLYLSALQEFRSNPQ
ncbi:MAG TPA: hypothetical protein VFV58_16870 [Blastocatellia bacterium]|jgi:hypothetical protein|nr:hypothetical protein [Blastocatellia bacterium]